MSLTSHQKEMVIGLVQMKINDNTNWLEELKKAGVNSAKASESLKTLYRLKDSLEREFNDG